MKRLFIDTNVLVSAIVFDGNELEVIIKSVESGDEIFISEHILEEAIRVFMKKFPKHLDMFERFLELSDIKIVDKEDYERIIKKFDDVRDKYDAHVLACAEKMACSFIISGDKDLLEYSKGSFEILRAPEYLKLFHKD